MEKQESSMLSHEDIVALFQELDALEQRVRVPEILVETPLAPEPPLVPQMEVFNEPGPSPDAEVVVKRRRHFSRMVSHEARRPRSVFHRQSLYDVEGVPGRTMHSTFTLSINEEAGSLVGFDQPKPKPEPFHLPFGRKPASSEDAAGVEKGRLGKLLSRFSRKGKTEGEKAGFAGRLKGLARRRLK